MSNLRMDKIIYLWILE